MCKVIEDMLKETAWQKTVEIVLRMVDLNYPVELIAYVTAITEEQVMEIAARRTA